MRLLTIVILSISLAACQRSAPPKAADARATETNRGDEVDGDEEKMARLREEMVTLQIERRGVKDSAVLDAMRAVPRHEFIPEAYRYLAYQDSPAPIGWDQTISQPYIVAAMTELLQVEPGEKVLEIGTGSGYQAAVLAEIGADVYSIEIVEPLCEWADAALERTRYDVHLRCGDGYAGWPEEAPFDAVIVTAAPPEIPEALVDQLAVGGRMVIPVGERYQQLKRLTKTNDGLQTETIFDVRFVPMVRGETADEEE